MDLQNPKVLLSRLDIKETDKVRIIDDEVFADVHHNATTTVYEHKFSIDQQEIITKLLPLPSRLKPENDTCHCNGRGQCKQNCSIIVSLGVKYNKCRTRYRCKTVRVEELRLDESNTSLDGKGQIRINLNQVDFSSVRKHSPDTAVKIPISYIREFKILPKFHHREQCDQAELPHAKQSKFRQCRVLLGRIDQQEQFLSNLGLQPTYIKNVKRVDLKQKRSCRRDTT